MINMAGITIDKVNENVLKLMREVEYIRKHMVDVDVILTSEEEERLDESLRDYEEGRAVSLEDFEKEMENAQD